MNRQQIVALANAINAIRPDWQQAGIVAQLHILASNWAGTDAALAQHAMTIAASPQVRTPAAFNATPPEPAEPPRPQQTQQRWLPEPTCHTCSRSRSKCAAYQRWELERGIPDPHDFETLEDADRRTNRRTV